KSKSKSKSKSKLQLYLHFVYFIFITANTVYHKYFSIGVDFSLIFNVL
ncbi:hypothetical protein MNBD_GAMMA12-2930, partial [hydrothermal vent metagenome]